MSEISLGTVYDINKQIMAEEKPMDAVLFNRRISEIADKISELNYTMLLCHELRDFTVFANKKVFGKTSKKAIENEVKETLASRGTVIDITKLEDGNFEIWIRMKNQEDEIENVVYYLFDYTFGVVEIF